MLSKCTTNSNVYQAAVIFEKFLTTIEAEIRKLTFNLAWKTERSYVFSGKSCPFDRQELSKTFLFQTWLVVKSEQMCI